MENNSNNVTRESTEIVSNGAAIPVSEKGAVREREDKTESPIRASLKTNMEASKETMSNKRERASKAVEGEIINRSSASGIEKETSTTPQDRVQVAPPNGMNKAEQDAFANPTAENAHVLQQYLSRRAYETQSDYTRKTMELAEMHKEIADIGQVVTPQVRDEYARQGIAVPDLVRRSIAWDKSFKTDRIGTALDFLDAYGIHPSELMNGYQEPQQEYLTREQASELAREEAQKLFETQQQSVLAEQNYNSVQSFIKAKPLFRDPGTAAQLEQAIAQEITGLRAQGIQASPSDLLEMGYDRVTKLHPVFAPLVSQLNAKQAADANHVDAQKALAASRTISKGPGSGSPKIKATNIRENLRMRMNGSR